VKDVLNREVDGKALGKNFNACVHYSGACDIFHLSECAVTENRLLLRNLSSSDMTMLLKRV
jgi:hypothetical protein